MNRFGKEEAEIKLKAVDKFAQTVGLKLLVSPGILVILSNVSTLLAQRIPLSAGHIRHTGFPQRHIWKAVRIYRINSTPTYSTRVLLKGQTLVTKIFWLMLPSALVSWARKRYVLCELTLSSQTETCRTLKATEFVHSNECLECVEKMVEAAKAQGINGVPFVIIDGKWAVNGLQSEETFVQVSHPILCVLTRPRSLMDLPDFP